MLGARKGSEVGEGSAVEFGDVWIEWFEGGGPEWTVREVKHLVKDIAWREVAKSGLEGRS